MTRAEQVLIIYSGIIAIRFHPKNDDGKKLTYKELAKHAIKAEQAIHDEMEGQPWAHS